MRELPGTVDMARETHVSACAFAVSQVTAALLGQNKQTLDYVGVLLGDVVLFAHVTFKIVQFQRDLRDDLLSTLSPCNVQFPVTGTNSGQLSHEVVEE